MVIMLSCIFYFIFTEGLVSYIIPKGTQRGNEVELSDKTYDGEDEGDRLLRGLGQLVDGQKGVDNFRSDVNGYGKGEVAKG
jgi:discoidin domain receptor family member 2